MKPGSPLLLALGLFLASASPLFATLIAYDGFESNTASALNGASGGEGWTTNWTAIAGATVPTLVTPLTYSNGDIVIDGGAKGVRLDASNDNAMVRSFTAPANSSTVYFSFLYRTAAGLDIDNFVQVMLNNDSTVANSGAIGDINQDASGFGARVGNSNGGNTPTAGSTVAYNEGVTYLLVGRLYSSTGSGNYNRMELFVNPSSLTEPSPSFSANDSGNASGFATVNTLQVRSLNINGDDILVFDEFRIGTTWADVVPEPGAGLLGVAALVALGQVRRRARRAN